MPRVDLSNAPSDAALEFSLAYRQYNASTSDRLMVRVSTDCGSSWNTLYDEAGADLASAPAGTGSFTPNATQWRAEAVDISSVIGQADVLFMFVSESDYGNNLYLDDVSIGNIVGIDGSAMDAIALFPNPNNGRFTLRSGMSAGMLDLRIHSIEGRLVHAERWTALQGAAIELGLEHLAQGSYVMALSNASGELSTIRFVIQ
jgi:hypothetical protein